MEEKNKNKGNKNYIFNDKERKTSAIILLVIVLILIAVLVTVNMIKKNEKDKENNNTNIENVNKSNYEEKEGQKINISKQVKETKEVKDLKDLTVANLKLVYTDGISKLVSKVTNNGSDKEDLTIQVKFLGNDNELINQASIYVGNIKKGETKEIGSGITFDVSNVKNVEYSL